MIAFLLAALLAYAMLRFALPIFASRSDAPTDGARQVGLGYIWAILASGAYAATVAVFADWQFLENARNLQLLLGSLFGFLVWVLPRAERLATPTRGGSYGGGLAEAGAEERGPEGPWWTRGSALVALALVALPVIVLIAPHGSLDLGFLRSVKTPFLEAQFAKNETEFRLELDSEPQGFFRVGPDGLGGALHLARNELILLRTTRGENAPATLAAERGLVFIDQVLQPLAQCIYEVDRLYGDRQLLVDSLHVMGAGLARSVVISARAEEASPEVEERIREPLDFALQSMSERKYRQLPALGLMPLPAGSPLAGHTCLNSPVAKTPAERDPRLDPFMGDLATIMAQPSVIHAASMYFLWAGNPRAALTMIKNKRIAGDGRPGASDIDDYPGLLHIRGFAERWVADRTTDPTIYLRHWQRAIGEFERRKSALLEAWGDDLLEDCGARSATPVTLGVGAIGAPLDHQDLASDEALAGKCDNDAGLCNVRLAYGYFDFQTFKLRNHVIYEAARELLTGRDFSERHRVLETAGGRAEELNARLEDDGLASGGCFAQQVIQVDDFGQPAARDRQVGVRPVAITTNHPQREYALALDAIGSLTLAGALVDGPVDTAEAERAIGEFQRALRMGAGADLAEGLMQTIREHRDNAREAIGLGAF